MVSLSPGNTLPSGLSRSLSRGPLPSWTSSAVILMTLFTLRQKGPKTTKFYPGVALLR